LLEKWSVTNFKSIPETRVIKADGEETDKLDVKPLTVFCGANSSGKSSLIQSILLMAQTMRNWDKEIPLALNGAYANLGAFDHVKTIYSETEEIGIRFTYKPKSDSVISKSEYPFNHIPSDLDVSKAYGFNVDAISGELVFLQPNKGERTRILPLMPRANFIVTFYQQNKGKPADLYANDIEKNRYILNWNVSKQEGKDRYDFKEMLVLPDEKTINIIRGNDSFFSSEIINHAELKEKLAEQFPFETNKIKWAIRHFFPENVNLEMNNAYFGLLSLTKSISDSLNIYNTVQMDKAQWDRLNSENTSISLNTSRNINLGVHYWHMLYDGIPVTLYEYIKNHILKGIDGVDDLLTIGTYKVLSETFIKSEDWKENLNKLEDEKKYLVNSRLNDHKGKIVILIFDFYKRIYSDMEHTFKSSDKLKKDRHFFNVIGSLLYGTSRALLDASYFINNYLSEIFDYFSKSIHYLGPLREDPKPLYPFPNGDNSSDLGRKGENTSGVLFLYGEDIIEDIPTPNHGKDNESKTNENIKIIDAVRQWLSYIGVADNIETKIIGSGISLEIQTPGSDEPTDLTNVGVGVSQVLPIVVMCLTAPKGTTLIFEQPELHLHPKMQTKLAEFFMAIANSGIQCIIETHSEHFVNAMRYNIAAAPLGKEDMIEKSVIYFVEKEEKKSIFREIKINDLGVLSRWPKDFFDEGINLTDKIILASSQKRAQKYPDDGGDDDE
jgi:predicted ATPase